ncbi:J domain-containing protein [filamentous cyanobacterium LEGE 11480]|uniref:J domain-containing protein n=1 Tax=Romeriopsis navalis LEGE 11480 TaxID=2777977 RepID=A0A928VSR2_9CYAN|nr:J domain-containing protein [Romeriopsis navalis]MBE9031855.1 J domain-containing protein [Romeriopsis navalis LEGE 11480]
MPDSKTHYQLLDVAATATPDEIKSAYRRLAKSLHPDRNEDASHEAIAQLNTAYEVLSDPLSRRSYDQQLNYMPTSAIPRHQRDDVAGKQYRRRQPQTSSDQQIKDWLKKVYTPGIRIINQIIKPLKGQIRELSADPFDDALMDVFVAYIETSRASLAKAEKLFKAVPNPPTIGGAAANIYYCLNQLSDALNELEYFTMSYNETSLHTGCEMFRIADGLKKEAQAAVREVPK